MKIHVLSALLALNASAPPSEFRLFKAGVNETENGYSVLFDDEAAASVMAAAERWGVQMMLDLEHESLADGPAVRPDQKDARAWFRLEVRPGPELWAVDVTWTSDGARRLAERTQRYVSPAFYTQKIEGQDGVERLVEIRNVALCAMPATRDALPLVATRLARDARAASIRRKHMSASVKRPSAKSLKAASKAVKDGDEDAALVALESLLDSFSMRALSLSPESAKSALEAVEKGDGNAALDVLKALLAEMATGGAPAPADEAAAASTTDPAGGAPDEEPPAAAAALAREAVAELRKTKTDLDAVRAELRSLTSERAARDAKDRAELVSDLVKLGFETPATAWEKDDKGEPVPGKPCKRLASEPVGEMRERVKALRAARPEQDDPKPPKGEIAELTPAQKEKAKKAGISEEDFARRRSLVKRHPH